MDGRRVDMLVETSQRLLRRGAMANLQRMLRKAHAADIAILFRHVSRGDRTAIFGTLENRARRAEVMSELETASQIELLTEVGVEEAAAVLEEMDYDDAANLMRSLPDEYGAELLQRMTKEESLQMEGLMGYAEDTAGGIMSPDFFALPEETTAQEAIAALRSAEELEMAFYVYVTNEFDHLVGVVSLRQLVIASASRTLADIMETDVVRVRAGTDQEEVARLVARYNFLAIPVVDDNNVLLGIVTVDDIIDVIREEATEDILQMAGAGDDMEGSRRLLTNLRGRLPWVVVAFCGGVITVPVLSAFVGSVKGFELLVLFIPLLLSLAGNVGIQTSTLVARELSTSALPLKAYRKALVRELAVGGILGIVIGLFAGVTAAFMGGTYVQGIAVGAAVAVGLAGSTLIGSVVPFVMTRLMTDPTYAMGPLVKAISDAITLISYLLLSSALLRLLA